MFESTRFQLTAWYLVIIMVITGLFISAFYHSSTREIKRLIDRIKIDQQLENSGLPIRVALPRLRNAPTLEELEELRHRSFITLLVVNGIILFFAGGASYFLAGRTLKPIQEMMTEQNDFISNASHELRTPLATLRAELEGSLLEKKISDTDARKLINSNLEEVGQLQTLANNLLKLASVHNQTAPKSYQHIELSEVLTIAHKKVSTLAKRKKLVVNLRTFTSQILADQSELTEAFIILLDNAIKYTPSGGKITVSMSKIRNNIKVTVSDTGVGIEPNELPHIFERFYRADKSRSTTDGYGLGLAIAKNIIETHEGKITVSSTLDHGSTFTVLLPATSLT